ncbi:MAG: 2OG-Fe(II) oxygenase [Polyangiaceae bacterium]
MTTYHWLSDQIFTVDDLYSADECDELIAYAETQGFEEAPVTTINGPVRMSQIRNNDRCMVDDPERAQELFRRADEFLTRRFRGWNVCGVNERLRFYRYYPGQRFDWHRDGSFRRNTHEVSFFTYMVYLNDDYEGGRTLFTYQRIEPKKGSALFFQHDLLYKGDTITHGTKYVLRTDVMYRDPTATLESV